MQQYDWFALHILSAAQEFAPGIALQQAPVEIEHPFIPPPQVAIR